MADDVKNTEDQVNVLPSSDNVILAGNGADIPDGGAITKEQAEELRGEVAKAEADEPEAEELDADMPSVSQEGDFKKPEPPSDSNFSDKANEVPDTAFTRAIKRAMNIHGKLNRQTYEMLINTLDIYTLADLKKSGIKDLDEDLDFIRKERRNKAILDDKKPTDLDEFFTKQLENDEAKKNEFNQKFDEKFKDGFSIKTLSNQEIFYGNAAGKPRITSSNQKDFKQETADCMIALSVTAGWKNLNVTGTSAQRDKLAIAIQKQNLLEQLEFERLQYMGKNKGEEYPPITCKNHKLSDAKQKELDKELEKIKKEFFKEYPEMKGHTSFDVGKNTPENTNDTKPQNDANKPSNKKGLKP